MTAHGDSLAETNEKWASIGKPSVVLGIVLGANQAVEVIEAAKQHKDGDAGNHDDERSHLTRPSSATAGGGELCFTLNYHLSTLNFLSTTASGRLQRAVLGHIT